MQPLCCGFNGYITTIIWITRLFLFLAKLEVAINVSVITNEMISYHIFDIPSICMSICTVQWNLFA